MNFSDAGTVANFRGERGWKGLKKRRALCHPDGNEALGILHGKKTIKKKNRKKEGFEKKEELMESAP